MLWGLLNDLGDLELVEHGLGRVAEGLLLGEAGPRFIWADHIIDGQGVGSGFNAGEVEFGQGVHVVEHAEELGTVVGGLLVSEFETGEFGDAVDVDRMSGHGQRLNDCRGAVCQCLVGRELRHR